MKVKVKGAGNFAGMQEFDYTTVVEATYYGDDILDILGSELIRAGALAKEFDPDYKYGFFLYELEVIDDASEAATS